METINQEKRNTVTPTQLMLAGLLLENGVKVYISDIWKHTKGYGPNHSFEGYKWSATGRALNLPGRFDNAITSVYSFDSMSDCLTFGITLELRNSFETGYIYEATAKKPE